VDVGAGERASDRRDVDNTPVMIVLTDGLSNPRPASEAVARAAAAKQAHVVIYAIGLGDTLDFEALRQIASEPGYFYHAPEAEDLGDIYRQIAVEIPCPAGQFWPWRQPEQHAAVHLHGWR
jgi:Mg-chelatase subunit ChlD